MTKILVADDDPVARYVLEDTLSEWGYDVVLADNGPDALQVLLGPAPPQIATLDWVMPGMEGPEICKAIRRQPHIPFIYAIVLTIKNNKEEIAAALDAGANDFLSKPVDIAELRSRLAVGVRTIAYEKTLLEKNAQLDQYAREMESLAEARAKQLLHAERLATLGTLSAGVAHEIANPVSFISGNLNTFETIWDSIEPLLRECREKGIGDAKKLDNILTEAPNIVRGIGQGVQRTLRLVRSLKNYARRGGEEPGPCNVNDCIENAFCLCHNRLKYNIEVHKNLDAELPLVQGVPQQLEQVLVNIIMNAADAMEATSKAMLDITTRREGGYVVIGVDDSGPGIPPDKMGAIWEPFYTSKGTDRGTGLGLSIVLGIIEEHRGKITATNRPEGGARFIIELPI